ncbi:MAG: 50S ribosomal protein L39e [Candidatus Micrarchaeales archaeon]
MTRNTQYKKRRLGKKIKQSRRLPLLTRLRTHQRLQQNTFKRDWRRTKMRLENDEK